MSSIFTSPVYKLEKLNHVYIVLTSKNCNQRCKQCYIDFPLSRQVKDFIDINKIKEMLIDTKNENLECIYLTGAEPMMHPNFNNIMRLCLKRTNLCICTNASFINEKKSRFLKKVEDESKYNLFFRFSLSHYNEQNNDSARYRGSFRQTLFAIKNLERYGLSVVLDVVNFYKEDEKTLREGFKELFNQYEISPEIFISAYFSKENTDDINGLQKECMFSRTLASNGIYSCPILANDFRGWMGASFKDYSLNVTGESPYCAQCKMFGV